MIDGGKSSGLALLLCSLLVLPADSGEPRSGRPESWAILKGLVKFGNRHAGAAKRAEAISRLARLLEARGLKTERIPFEAQDPRTGRVWPMTNLVGRFRPQSPCRFLLGSHFDARHEAEMDPDPAKKAKPIEGANDSGSGVAVLLALASRFAETVPAGVGVDVVLFDGEEMGYQDVGGYCMGSRHYAAMLSAAGLTTPARPPMTANALPYGRQDGVASAPPRFAVVLDMVASPKTVFKIESYSYEAHPRLVEALWEIGSRRAPKAFSRERWGWIRDDHVPLSEAGVPSVLVIGYDDPRWHTSGDVLAGLSPERLALAEGMLEELMKERLSSFLGGCP